MPVRAVIFDLDDTLVAQEATDREVCRLVCRLAEERHGTDASLLAESVLGQAEKLWRESETHAYCASIGIGASEGLHGDFPAEGAELETLRAWLPAYRRQTWRQALRTWGVVDEALETLLESRFATERNARGDVYDDALPVLQALEGRFVLGLLTNGGAALQRRKLEQSGLASFFRTVVISGEVGVGKPDATVFRIALERLGVLSHEAVMVGDSLARDVQGALNAGLHAVWLNRGGAASVPGHHHEVRGLDALPDLVGSLA